MRHFAITRFAEHQADHYIEGAVSMDEIHPADPALRRLVLYIVVIIAAAAVAGVIVFQRWFANVQLLPPDEAWLALLGALSWTGGVMLLIVIVASVYALRLGAKIKRIGQYPLADARTFRDTLILHGKQARSRGNLLQMIGALLLVLAVLLFVLCVRMVSMFSNSAV
jgi:hypothetical protein